jgi:tetratricopeptide (TPR) repeat protein
MRLAPIVALAVCLVAGLSAQAAEDAGLLRAREGGAALARGDVDRAIALFTEALADKKLPNDRRATILTDRGVAYARRQSPREAIEDFNRAIQLYPEFAAVYNNRGNVLLAIGAVREAMKDFDRALVLAPGYAAAFSNRAGGHMKLGEIDRAVADYTRAITLVPANAPALTGRGRAHLAAYRPLAAIRDLTRAVVLDARFSAGYRSRAEARLALGRYEEAIEDFSRAIAFESRNAALYALRGGAYLDAGNVASAVKDYTTAIELDPRSAAAHVMRGFAYAKAEAYEDALKDFARAIELDPRSARAFAYRAWTYRRQQQPELGLKDVERALKLDGSSAEGYWARGEIHEAQGRSVRAVQDLKKALSLDPLLKEAARTLERLGVSTKAEEAEVAGAGLDGWRVLEKGHQYVATNERFPRLKVDIEMMGKGRPRILEWEEKTAPFAGIGVLRFHAGTVESARGPEELEQVAIVDLQSNAVVSVEAHKRGTRLARLTWDDGKLVVASADGIHEEFQLRQAKAKEAPAPPRKRYAGEQKGPPSWSPWESGGRRGRRSKTLFELLFGN